MSNDIETRLNALLDKAKRIKEKAKSLEQGLTDFSNEVKKVVEETESPKIRKMVKE